MGVTHPILPFINRLSQVPTSSLRYDLRSIGPHSSTRKGRQSGVNYGPDLFLFVRESLTPRGKSPTNRNPDFHFWDHTTEQSARNIGAGRTVGYNSLCLPSDTGLETEG